MEYTELYKVEVELLKDFPVIKETLSRMGIKNTRKRLFYPSCYCIEEGGKYYIVHFKELFKTIGKESTLDETDKIRTKTIAFFLDKWGIVKLKDSVDEILQEKIHVLPKSEKDEYRIVHKFKFSKPMIRKVSEI
jgi:hypothetical protein